MTIDSALTLPPLKITVKVDQADDRPGDWRVRATAKFGNQDYDSTYLLPKDVYIFSLPHVMSKLLHEVAHQIVVTHVGQNHASNGRH